MRFNELRVDIWNGCLRQIQHFVGWTELYEAIGQYVWNGLFWCVRWHIQVVQRNFGAVLLLTHVPHAARLVPQMARGEIKFRCTNLQCDCTVRDAEANACHNLPRWHFNSIQIN